MSKFLIFGGGGKVGADGLICPGFIGLMCLDHSFLFQVALHFASAAIKQGHKVISVVRDNSQCVSFPLLESLQGLGELT